MINENKHKSGFVNIVGNPNVGKSTLMNLLTGENLSIITSKAQTTRHRILGIVNTPEYQIVYSDTPGLLQPQYRLQEQMLAAARSAFADADILLYMTDVVETAEKNEEFVERLRQMEVPVLVLINKIDKSNQVQVQQLTEHWQARVPKAEIYPLSATNRFNVETVRRRIVELLPLSPPYFEKDAITDRPARFFVSEIIRQKMLLYYQKEIPYSVEVIVEEFKESDKLLSIRALLVCERQTQKGIIIGHGGQALKKVGAMARKDIERFFAKQVFLALYVKVEENWRSRDNLLKRYGYIAE